MSAAVAASASASASTSGPATIASRQLRYRMLSCPGEASAADTEAGQATPRQSENGCRVIVPTEHQQQRHHLFSPWVRLTRGGGGGGGGGGSGMMELTPLPIAATKPAAATAASHRAEQLQDPLLIDEAAMPGGRKLTGLQIVSINFVRFCQTTSLRGVPKIVKTKEKLLKFIWAAFVLAFFVGCLTCLGLIVHQYLEHDVIHQPKTMRNYPVEFPSFTVCNTRPLSQAGISYIHSHNLMLPKEFSKQLVKAIVNTNKNLAARPGGQALNKTEKDALSTIFDTKGYFENLPPGVDMNQFGHTLEHTILHCESTILMNSFKRSHFCDNIGKWTRTYDNKFLNCYTFTADAEDTKSILTVRIMAFTNERNLTHCPDCSSFPATQVSGLRVQLHNAGNYPEVQEEGLNIKPGSLTEIRFDTKKWTMKEPPHGRCSQRVPPALLFKGTSFTYSYQACKNRVLHERIHSQCGCLDSSIPLPDSLGGSSAGFCGRTPEAQFSLLKNAASGALAANSESPAARRRLADFYGLAPNATQVPSFASDAAFAAFLQRVTCNMQVFIAADNVTADKCFTPCTFFTYDTTISTTNWPTRAYLYEMVDDFAYLMQRIDEQHLAGLVSRNSSYLEPIYQELKRIYKPVLAVRNNVTEAERLLRDIDYVQRNFIEILINRGKSNFDIEVIEEKAVISLTSLLSQIGGLLSIWVGLTFVSIVEVIELVYNIIVMCTSRQLRDA